MTTPRSFPAPPSSLPDRFGSSKGLAMPALPGMRWATRSARTLKAERKSASGMHNLPGEILQQVFSFATLGGNSALDVHRVLHNLCRVDREWRNAAVKCSILWTRLPVADFEDTKQTVTYRQLADALKLYLARSGALPISFALKIEQRAWIEDGPLVAISLDVLDLLVDQCHRWDEVELKASCFLPVYLQLSPIKGRLPLLTKLKLALPVLYLHDLAFDLFEDAPRLRDLEYHIHWCDHFNTSVAFPWSNLENFTHVAKSDGLEVYDLLLDSQPTKLRSLEYQARSIATLPTSVSIPLPYLEKLILRIANDIECDIFSHLDALTLPSLTHLELWGRLLAITQGPYDAVRALVERSGCSLHTLILCLSNSRDASSEHFTSLLAKCPSLESLHLRAPGTDVLRALILDPGSEMPLLPNLRTLGIHSHGPFSWEDRILEGEDLALVIESRTNALQAHQNPHPCRMLENVVLVYYASAGVQQAVLRQAFLKDLDEKVDERSKNVVEKALDSLYWVLGDHGAWLYRRKCYNPLFLARMDRALRSLENLNFKKRHTEVLLRYGLPTIMHRIGHYRDNKWLLPSDGLLLYRVRARRLVRKWRPFILRDARAAKFRWCYYGGGVVRLRCNHEYEGIEETNEEIWKDILGTGAECSEYTSLKGWMSVL